MTKTWKTIISLFLMAAMLLAMAVPALADGEKVIRTAISDDPEEMDPTRNSYSRSSRVLQNLFVGLYKLGADGVTLEPAMAESVDISEDGLTYTFHLRLLLAARSGPHVQVRFRPVDREERQGLQQQ